jgi:hypothetical protein
MQLPPAIIFVNADLNDTSKATLQSQLYINQTITDIQFDDVIAIDPTFPDQIHLNGARVLVIRQNFMDLTNRNLADVVIFVKQGLATIEKNNLGPPGLSLPLERLNIYALLRGNNSQYVVILPEFPSGPKHSCGCFCHPRQNGFRGIVGIEWHANDLTGVHLPNCDNIYNNPDFINRK